MAKEELTIAGTPTNQPFEVGDRAVWKQYGKTVSAIILDFFGVGLAHVMLENEGATSGVIQYNRALNYGPSGI